MNLRAGGEAMWARARRFAPAALMAELPVFVVHATNTELIPFFARPVFGDTSGAAGFTARCSLPRLSRRSDIRPRLRAMQGERRPATPASSTSAFSLAASFGGISST